MNQIQPTISGRKRVGTTVFKMDSNGNQVAIYSSLHIAQQLERRSYRFLMAAIQTGNPLNNHFFTIGQKYQRRISKALPKQDNPYPWESKGIFDIDAWGQLFH